MNALIALHLLAAVQLPQVAGTCPLSFDPRQISVELQAMVEDTARYSKALGAVARFLEDRWSRDRYWTARREVEWAIQNKGRHAVLEYALGLLYARGPDLIIGSDRGVLHRRVRTQTNAETYARRHLLAAARSGAAPIGSAAAAELARLALATRTRQTLEAAQEALDHVDPAQPCTDILRSYLSTASGEAKAGESSARRALSITCPSCPAAYHALSLALNALGETDSAGAYYLRGLSLAEEGGDHDLAPFYEDLRPLLLPEETAAFEALAPGERSQWIRRYWDLSAARSGRALAARVGEHLRRLGEAHVKYRRNANLGAPPVQAILVEPPDGDLPWDHRGLLFIRHGVPDDVLVTLGGEIALNETWVYRRADGIWLFNFAKYDYPDWVFIPGIGCTERDLRGDLAAAANLKYMYNLERAPYDRRFLTLAQQCLKAGDRDAALDATMTRILLAELRAEQRETIMEALATESAARRFEKPLDVMLNAYGFREAGRTLMTVPVWVRAVADPAERPRSLDVSLALIAGHVSRVDTLVTLPAAPPGVEATWRLAFSLLPDSTGPAHLRAALADADDPARGADLGMPRHVPDLAGAGPAISDIVVAIPGEAGVLRRGGVALSPLPGHVVIMDQPFRLYYELYGLPAGAPYRTTIRIETVDEPGAVEALLRLFRRRRADLELTFRDIAAGDVAREDRTISTDLVPGHYRLRVRVELPDGLTLERETRLEVRSM